MISDRLLDLMVRELVFLTPSVSVSESRDRRVAQMFSTTFRPEYHSYSDFYKRIQERGVQNIQLVTRPEPNLTFLSTRSKPPNLPFFVDPTQTSCLSTPPKPPLFSRPDPNLSCLTTRPKPSLFVDPNQPSIDPLSYYWIIDICLPQQSLKFVSRVRLIPVILVITERDGVSCLVKKSKMESTWVTDFFLLKSICIYLFILDAAGSCYIRVSQKCFRAVIRR